MNIPSQSISNEREHSGTLGLNLKRQLEGKKNKCEERDNKFDLIKNAETIKQAFHL